MVYKNIPSNKARAFCSSRLHMYELSALQGRMSRKREMLPTVIKTDATLEKVQMAIILSNYIRT